MEKVYEGNLVEVFKITDRLYFRRANLPIRSQCNSAFIVGDNGIAVVDAPPGGIEMVEETEKIFGKPITALFLTHGHGDHAGGLEDFLNWNFPQGLTIYCSQRFLETFSPAEHTYEANFVGVDGILQIVFSGGVEIELFTARDIMHSKWDMFIRIPGPDVFCTGDTVVEFQSAYFHSADISSWISNLRVLSDRRGKYILAGHGQELFPWSYINEFTTYLEKLQHAANACKELYRPDPTLTEKERFADVSTGEIKKLVNAFFSEDRNDIQYIEERAGKEHAQREVRMILWALIRSFIR
ncbi:MAG: MBL fold metallo-hydrolase [Treponema sp.]|jgi:glyoxylase-like metal-dependent hydrolase (beta-lactamase superfamily II)|nr:MBL fold metallo-hydrolase [Treponema sp.]